MRALLIACLLLSSFPALAGSRHEMPPEERQSEIADLSVRAAAAAADLDFMSARTHYRRLRILDPMNPEWMVKLDRIGGECRRIAQSRLGLLLLKAAIESEIHDLERTSFRFAEKDTPERLSPSDLSKLLNDERHAAGAGSPPLGDLPLLKDAATAALTEFDYVTARQYYREIVARDPADTEARSRLDELEVACTGNAIKLIAEANARMSRGENFEAEASLCIALELANPGSPEHEAALSLRKSLPSR